LAVGLAPLGLGTLTPAADSATGRLTLNSGGFVQHRLNAVAASGVTGATITLALADASGKTVATATLAVGQVPLSFHQYLPAGDYTATLTLGLLRGLSGSVVTYLLSGGLGSDPVGPSRTTTATGPGTTGTTTTTDPTATTADTFSFIPVDVLLAFTFPYSF
jgi:hypothetical protein